jgi:VWFA-related protein
MTSPGGRVHLPVKRLILILFLVIACPLAAQVEAPVRITSKPSGLVHGTLAVPVLAAENVVRVELVINGVPFGQRAGRSVVFNVPLGLYIRRLRFRAIGFDATGSIVGEDEMVVNDPQPPFRVRLLGNDSQLTASVIAPQATRISGVEFFIGEQSIGVDTVAPYSVPFDPSAFPERLYATATATGPDDQKAFDVFFWGDAPREHVDVLLQQIPLSVAELQGNGPLVPGDLELIDNGQPRAIEAVVPAADQPINAIVLVDSSESMLEELPMLKKAASDFARSIVRPNGRVALVAFAQQRIWLTPFTGDVNLIDRGLEQLRPRGQTHLYDAVIEMLFELQKMPGRKALVVLTDGVNQGGSFELDHVVHYARYAGVPVYPVVRNTLLSRFMKFGIGGFQAKKFAAMARDSGATYFIVQKPSELPGVYRRISDELRRQHLLVFYSESEEHDRWHSLDIRPRRKGTYRVPRGYFP